MTRADTRDGRQGHAPSGRHIAKNPAAKRALGITITDGADELLDLSDERDQWHRFALDWARSAYRRGYQAGRDAGYRAGYELAVREWKITAAGMTHLGGPSFAELDRRRYPPGGRLSWIIPRSGDDTRGHHG